MNRRTFLETMGGGLAAASPALAASKPNLVILFADDLGYGDLGCYGHPTMRTPHLDRMAVEGVRFTQFYAAAPVCTPSRAALLTGRLPIRSGLTRVLFPYSDGGIQDNEVTIAEALKPAGYATACVGKWHLGHLPQYLPTRHGFDRYFGIPYSNDMARPFATGPRYNPGPPLPLMRNEEIIETNPDQAELTPRYTAEATAFIRDAARARKPFFLYLPYTFPHVPLFASARFQGKSARGLYGDVVEEIDWSVGEILGALRHNKVDRDTLVMFTSDNGPWLIKKEEGGSAGLLREGKGSTWEGGMREPFLARWPGRIPAGTVSAEFGSTMDLFPTCLAAAGLPLPPGIAYDGQDLGPYLRREKSGREALLYYYSDTELRAVRKGPWKLHVASNAPWDGPPGVQKHDPPLLFHLLHDPSERYDLAAKHPDVVRELLGAIEEHRRTLTPGALQR